MIKHMDNGEMKWCLYFDLTCNLISGHRMTWKQYHRLEDIHGFMDYLAKTYPTIVSVNTIGKSYEGRELKVNRIGRYKIIVSCKKKYFRLQFQVAFSFRTTMFMEIYHLSHYCWHDETSITHIRGIVHYYSKYFIASNHIHRGTNLR